MLETFITVPDQVPTKDLLCQTQKLPRCQNYVPLAGQLLKACFWLNIFWWNVRQSLQVVRQPPGKLSTITIALAISDSTFNGVRVKKLRESAFAERYYVCRETRLNCPMKRTRQRSLTFCVVSSGFLPLDFCETC